MSEPAEQVRIDRPGTRRRETRFALKPPLELGVHGASAPGVRARLVNVSLSGTAILADVLLGDRGVMLGLDLPDHTASERAPVPCQLQWVLAEKNALSPRWFHGARFGPIDAQARRLIEDLIHDARRTEPNR